MKGRMSDEPGCSITLNNKVRSFACFLERKKKKRQTDLKVHARSENKRKNFLSSFDHVIQDFQIPAAPLRRIFEIPLSLEQTGPKIHRYVEYKLGLCLLYKTVYFCNQIMYTRRYSKKDSVFQIYHALFFCGS